MANKSDETKKKKTVNTTKTTKKISSSAPKKNTTKKITSENKINTDQKEKQTNAILTVLGIIVLVIVAIIIFRLTYAYFTATIDDKNPNNQDVVIETADLIVRYEDGKSNIELGGKILPGDIITKEFSVVNDGNDVGYYTIVLQNYENHFDRERSEDEAESDFKYNLFKIDENNNESLIATGYLPLSTTPIEIVLYTQDGVEKGKTNKYKLEIEYINLSTIDQSDDMGSLLETKINIIESSAEQRIAN